jgi:AraC-like DNA-binding protein
MDDLLLRPGDFVLIPHGEGHRLVSEPGQSATVLWDVPREQVSECYELLQHGEGGEPARMICGAVRFEHPAAQHLVALLPKAIHLEASASSHGDWMGGMLRLMAEEAKELRPGGEAVITRLADILVVQAIRAWIASEPAPTGWLGALKDRDIGEAIRLIHRHPDRDWSVTTLAQEVHMSRSAFSRRFTDMVGEAPMAYVTRWRMQLAVTWLGASEVKVSELPQRLGYSSEAAFSRAFKRTMGMSPGSVSRGAPSVASTPP